MAKKATTAKTSVVVSETSPKMEIVPTGEGIMLKKLEELENRKSILKKDKPTEYKGTTSINTGISVIELKGITDIADIIKVAATIQLQSEAYTKTAEKLFQLDEYPAFTLNKVNPENFLHNCKVRMFELSYEKELTKIENAIQSVKDSLQGLERQQLLLKDLAEQGL